VTRYTTPPQHGERRCYLRGCQRPECEAANRRYTKQLRLDRERGVHRLIDNADVKQHIERLTEAGWTQAQVSRASKVSASHLSGIASGGSRFVSPRIATRILAVPVGPAPADDRFIDATGSSRRIRALIAFGYPATSLTQPLQLAESAIGRIARMGRPQVCATTAETIARAYKRLSRIPGPDNRTRIMAARKGYLGPLAWDEHTIDDPAAQPDICEPYSPPAKNGRDSLRMAELEHLLNLGESEAAIAKQMGASEAYIRHLATVIRSRKKASAPAAVATAA
jgi:hypothetical protein